MEQLGGNRCSDAHDQMDGMELLLRETNHRIANSLQAVMALFARQREAPDTKTWPDRNQMLGRISAIAQIHRLLSTTQAFGAIEIGDYLGALVVNLRALWCGDGRVEDIALFCASQQVSADAAIRVGIVVNELVTNSCKHAYRDGDRGEVRIGFSIRDGAFTLLVADNGHGMGFGSSSQGQGTVLVSRIAEQLGAGFQFHCARPGTIAALVGQADRLLAAPAAGGMDRKDA
jgi:two-component sensor histidine kinase